MSTSKVRVRLYASARAASGTGEIVVELPGRASIADALATLTAVPGQPLDRVLARCSFLVNGESTTDRQAPVCDGDTVDVMPPFAGG